MTTETDVLGRAPCWKEPWVQPEPTSDEDWRGEHLIRSIPRILGNPLGRNLAKSKSPTDRKLARSDAAQRRREEVQRRHAAGETVQQIARNMKIETSTIRDDHTRLGLGVNPGSALRKKMRG